MVVGSRLEPGDHEDLSLVLGRTELVVWAWCVWWLVIAVGSVVGVVASHRAYHWLWPLAALPPAVIGCWWSWRRWRSVTLRGDGTALELRSLRRRETVPLTPPLTLAVHEVLRPTGEGRTGTELNLFVEAGPTTLVLTAGAGILPSGTRRRRAELEAFAATVAGRFADGELAREEPAWHPIQDHSPRRRDPTTRWINPLPGSNGLRDHAFLTLMTLGVVGVSLGCLIWVSGDIFDPQGQDAIAGQSRSSEPPCRSDVLGNLCDVDQDDLGRRADQASVRVAADYYQVWVAFSADPPRDSVDTLRDATAALHDAETRDGTEPLTTVTGIVDSDGDGLDDDGRVELQENGQAACVMILSDDVYVSSDPCARAQVDEASALPPRPD